VPAGVSISGRRSGSWDAKPGAPRCLMRPGSELVGPAASEASSTTEGWWGATGKQELAGRRAQGRQPVGGIEQKRGRPPAAWPASKPRHRAPNRQAQRGFQPGLRGGKDRPSGHPTTLATRPPTPEPRREGGPPPPIAAIDRSSDGQRGHPLGVGGGGDEPSRAREPARSEN